MFYINKYFEKDKKIPDNAQSYEIIAESLRATNQMIPQLLYEVSPYLK